MKESRLPAIMLYTYIDFLAEQKESVCLHGGHIDLDVNGLLCR